MPFAAAIPLISAGVGALGSIFGGKGGGQSASPANPNQSEIDKLMASLNAPGSTGDNADTNQASNFYRTILGGGQDATRSLLGPDVDTILGQYDNAAKAATQLGPRGGGRDAALADVGFQKAGAYGKLLAGAKQTAAQGLAGIGGQKMQAATTARGQQVSELGSLLGSNTAANDLAFQKQQEQNKQYSQLGSGIGSFLTNVLKARSKKNSDGGSSDSSGSGLTDWMSQM